MTKQINQLKPGDVVTSIPYGGPERLPIQVSDVLHARAAGYRILVGVDSFGRDVQVPVGHYSNTVEVEA